MRLSLAPRSVGRAGALVASAFLVVAPALHAGPPAASPAAAAGTGTITGRLVWAGGAVPDLKIETTAANSKDAVCKVAPIFSKEITIDRQTKGIANAVVYLVKPAGDYSETEKALLEKAPDVVVDQVNCEFVPYVSVVHKEQKLIFKSSDPVGHNVHFTPFANPQINNMLAPNGKMTYAIKKEERRPAKLVCDIHPWMTSYVMILDHPFAAVTKPDGSFEIAGVPAGNQQLVVWHSNGYANPGGNKGDAVKVPSGGTVDAGEFKITALKKSN